MSNSTLVLHRAEGLFSQSAADTKIIVKVGAGSLGSEFLSQIAYQFGLLVIVDPDRLKIENIERHRLGMKYLNDGTREVTVLVETVPADTVAAEGGTMPSTVNSDPTAAQQWRELAEMVTDWTNPVVTLPKEDSRDLSALEMRGGITVKFLGWNKAEAMRDWLISEKGIPADRIVAHATTIQEVLDLYERIDLIVVSIDDQPSCRWVNDQCVARDVPAIYGGVHPKGSGGEIISIPYPQDVCYGCAELSRGNRQPVDHGANYGVDVTKFNASDENLKAVPALHKSVTAIAVDMAFAAFHILFPEGGELKPVLLYHALDDWTQVAQLAGRSEELTRVSQMIAIRKRLMLSEDTMRFGAPNALGQYPLEIRRDYWPRLLVRKARCQMHGVSAAIDQL